MSPLEKYYKYIIQKVKCSITLTGCNWPVDLAITSQDLSHIAEFFFIIAHVLCLENWINSSQIKSLKTSMS